MSTEQHIYRALPMADERVVTQRPRLERAMVLSVMRDSAASEAGVCVGDILLSINDFPMLDIVDYQFHTAGEHVRIELLRGAEKHVYTLDKGYDEDLGMEFADDLFDRVHICKNKCVFCFLYQQPKGLRGSLYIKDDDYRLSFLHGNYLTLTNMGDAEFARVIEQRLTPLFVSVHATDPAVRGQMLGRKGPEAIQPRLAMLADARIQVHAQVVLCPGYNDGAILTKTVNDLAALHPNARETFGGVLSVAVVPVGLTQFRDRLAALTTCSPEFCRDLISEADSWRDRYRNTLGTNFVFLSDEIYLHAGAPIPSARDYEGFPQLEDGIGLVRQFADDLGKLKRRLPKRVFTRRTATLVTGKLAEPMVSDLASLLNAVDGLSVNVAAVDNAFFEGNITVAGLLTGRDITTHLLAMGGALGERVVLPSIMLRDPDRDVFLDDVTLADFASAIGRPVCVVERMPSAAADALIG